MQGVLREKAKSTVRISKNVHQSHILVATAVRTDYWGSLLYKGIINKDRQLFPYP